MNFELTYRESGLANPFWPPGTHYTGSKKGTDSDTNTIHPVMITKNFLSSN